MSAKKSSAKSSSKTHSNHKSGKSGNTNVGKEALQNISTKLNAASELIVQRLDEMDEGDKVTLKDLAEMITKRLDIPPANLNPLINLVIDNYPGLSRAKGRHGGIYKGDAPLTAKQLDHRERCPHCKQVMRVKGERKKKTASSEETASA